MGLKFTLDRREGFVPTWCLRTSGVPDPSVVTRMVSSGTASSVEYTQGVDAAARAGSSMTAVSTACRKMSYVRATLNPAFRNSDVCEELLRAARRSGRKLLAAARSNRARAQELSNAKGKGSHGGQERLPLRGCTVL